MAANAISFHEYVQPFLLAHENTTIPYGIGCAWLGKSGLDSDTLRAETNVLHRAFELGFRYFDTSLQYGESELVTGNFVKDAPRRDIVVATKTPIPITATARQAAEIVKRNIDGSLRRLQTDYIDLYQLHDIETLVQVLDSDHVLQVLREAKDSGVIRYFGLATRDLYLLETAASAGFDTILTYSDYTPLEQPAAALIDTAHSLGVGIINASPLAAGLLTGADPAGGLNRNEEEARRKSLAIELFDMCRKFPVSIRSFALQFPLRNERIAINLTGPATAEEVLSTYVSLSERIQPDLWKEWGDWMDRRSAWR